ncbi:BlaI/MecI/CopY family transcriptional regulator [Paenibacillus paeoniae]|uniref:BlaI/MecI/CopY family transcriptional regulator n=1 Tax=Paenibacillus paeoniae TaxID=2292705 RepID=A0A371PFP8_9BACL|nr:BlaI/MecI/CopY family transcriptional regulator [Paenibacillus paeoniae]REK74318.1 BlaI/MecI/CopY family transcriptional regulator [Paenibacillus paeoniae]
MRKIPSISEAEWEVMTVLWRKSPITAQEVIETLEDDKAWMPKTIKALISRLLKKGAVSFVAEGKTYYYSPALSEDECYRSERKSFLQRFYKGAPAPMLIHFLEDEQLTKEEIQELKRILNEKE